MVYASGDMSLEYRYRVDSTDSLLRVEIEAGEYGRSIVVEAPRRQESSVPVSIVHPGTDFLTGVLRSELRLQTRDPAEHWLESSFDKESLPIVLRPFDSRSLEIDKAAETGLGVSRAAARSEPVLPAAETALEFDFGPAEGCEEQDRGIVCTGGASEVIGEESTYPW